MSDTNCPFCGAEKSYRSVCEIIEPTSPLYQAIPFRCGSKNGHRSDLCREREAHNQTKRERDEAQATLTTIHRWIERNHPDGFIDSMTFHQNLERVGDRWYDRLDIVERERDEAREGAK